MTGLLNPTFKRYPPETAAYKLAEEQYAPGVTCRMNPQTFRVEYIRPDGSKVPGYEHFLELAYAGKI